jgi:hypothetical protein
VTEDSAVGGHFRLAAETLGGVRRDPLVDAGLAGGQSRQPGGRLPAVSGTKPNDLS